MLHKKEHDLTNLHSIFGGAWQPPTPAEPVTPASPETQLIQAIIGSGIEPPNEVILDGRMHRFSTNGRAKNKDGWYVAFSDGIPAGRYGCWRDGVEASWRADVGRRLTAEEDEAASSRIAEARAARDIELARHRADAADQAAQVWESAQAASSDHPYLSRKGIMAHGARVAGDGRLVVPLYTEDGELASVQYIAHDGGKLYQTGGKTGGCMWCIGNPDAQAGPVYIAEGYATAATIYEATGRPCWVAYSASNLAPVSASLRERYGVGQELTIVADHDLSGTGQKYADQAAAKHGVRVIMPPEAGQDANDFVQAGGDLVALLTPPKTDWLMQADDFSSHPMQIRWMIKGWLQESALIMVHGPSGGGKTFVVLDMVLRIAAGMGEWMGRKVKPGRVVYLAGEGHHGLRARVAGWKTAHGVASLGMWLSRTGCDLNKAEGMQLVLTAIRALTPENRPDVIVVDTLHRFLSGDENKSEDTKTMLDACAILTREFNCAVILVHHTGVSEDAQHRARGSSAWRGALDIEISVTPATAKAPISIKQMKNKDSELTPEVSANLQKVFIPGWVDEDGEAVTTAVLTPAEKPDNEDRQIEHTPAKVSAHRVLFESVWFECGMDLLGGSPYVSRSALREKLIQEGNADRTVTNMLSPTRQGAIISELISASIIVANQTGWTVEADTHASAMLLLKKAAT